jgi:hypothetical protein
MALGSGIVGVHVQGVPSSCDLYRIGGHLNDALWKIVPTRTNAIPARR